MKFLDKFRPTKDVKEVHLNPLLMKQKQISKNVTPAHTKRFHEKKSIIENIIIGKMDKHETIYGAQALNRHLPSHLDVHTRDFDIFTPTPTKDARETEKALDKEFGGNFFFIIQAEHPGTIKVKAYATDETYADYTKPDKKIPSVLREGLKVVPLSFIKKSLKRTLADPEQIFRHPKDLDALNRIKVFEKQRLF